MIKVRNNIIFKNILDFPFNLNFEFIQIHNEENQNEIDSILQFGTDNEESAINLYKIIHFLKTL